MSAHQNGSRRGPEGQLDGARNDILLEKPGAQLTAERAVSVEGRRGREIEIKLPGKGTMVGRLTLVEDQLIAQLVASSRLESYRAEVDRFFNSLKLLPGAPRGVLPP